MIDETRRKAMHYRAWHRGTREADFLIGGFCDRYADGWNPNEAAWFEALLNEEDHDIMAWAIGTAEAPARYAGPLMQAMQKLDYIPIAK